MSWLLNVDMDGQGWGRYTKEVDKVSDMDQLHESGFVGGKQDCSMNFTTNEEIDYFFFM